MQFLLLGFLIVGLDQLSKALLPTLATNRGLAFGLLGNHPTVALTILGVAAGVTVWFSFKRYKHSLGQLGWSLVLAGLVSNVVDRLFYAGAVRDPFLVWKSIPAFNGADVSIVLGLLVLLFGKRPTA